MKKLYTPNSPTRLEPTAPSPWRYVGLAALAIYWLAMLTGTHYPRIPNTVMFTSGFDKVCHFVGFAGLAFLAGLAWSLQRSVQRPLGRANLALILAVLTVYGSLDELTQPLVGRSCEFADWIADLAGAAAGLTAFAMTTLLTRQRSHHAPRDERTEEKASLA